MRSEARVDAGGDACQNGRCRFPRRREPEMSEIPALPKTQTVVKTERPRLHKVILFNDDYTPREFVVVVLRASSASARTRRCG